MKATSAVATPAQTLAHIARPTTATPASATSGAKQNQATEKAMVPESESEIEQMTLGGDDDDDNGSGKTAGLTAVSTAPPTTVTTASRSAPQRVQAQVGAEAPKAPEAAAVVTQQGAGEEEVVEDGGLEEVEEYIEEIDGDVTPPTDSPLAAAGGEKGRNSTVNVDVDCNPTELALLLNMVCLHYPLFGAAMQWLTIIYLIVLAGFFVATTQKNPRRPWPWITGEWDESFYYGAGEDEDELAEDEFGLLWSDGEEDDDLEGDFSAASDEEVHAI